MFLKILFKVLVAPKCLQNRNLSDLLSKRDQKVTKQEKKRNPTGTRRQVFDFSTNLTRRFSKKILLLLFIFRGFL